MGSAVAWETFEWEIVVWVAKNYCMGDGKQLTF